MFEYRGLQPSFGLNSMTDGTSGTVLVGEVLPYQTADISFWHQNGGTAGMTVPINWNSNKVVPVAGVKCGNDTWQSPGAQIGCRFSSDAKGFKSQHPGGANFLFGDGSVKFLKATINMATYCALGSRAGGEVVSADAF